MPFKKGQSGNPLGRPRTAEKHARAIASAEKRIADHLPELIDNMLVLANGGYERIDDEYQPAGLVYVGSGEFARRAFPDLPDDEPVLVKRKRTIADRDRQANEYLINRIMGKPTERKEITGDSGQPLFPDFERGLQKAYADEPESDQPA